MADFGELKRVDIRNIWATEPKHFTKWLAENLPRLAEALGMDLEFTESEANVGDFAVDIVAKDLGSGRNVIIENQFGSTDHDHLGKLLTYAAGFDASAVIWVAENIREEHRQALEWLNERTGTETMIFGVVVEVLQIDESKPAVNFRPLVFPNQWQKTKRGGAGKVQSPRVEAYREFFQELIDELREKHKFTGAKVGQPQSWYMFTSGFPRVYYGVSFALGARVRAELYIDQDDKSLFDSLYADRDKLHEEFAEPLEWERLDEKRASRVALYRPGSIDDDDATLHEVHSWAVEKLLKLEKVFSGRLKQRNSRR